MRVGRGAREGAGGGDDDRGGNHGEDDGGKDNWGEEVIKG